MALTLRSNGVGGGLVSAQWWNDYYNLLTGVMTDQYINITQGMTLKQITYTTPAAPTLALAASTALGIGSYTYAIVYQNNSAQSLPGTTATITTTSGNQQVNLSAIATGPTPATASRIIYRSKVGTSSPLFKVTTINDNTTTTYSDTTPDSSLGGQAPSHDYFGGSLIIKDQNNNFNAQIYNDGAVKFDAGSLTSDGTGNVALKGLTMSGRMNGGFPSAQTLTTNAAITLPSGPVAVVTCAAAVTGITIPNGNSAGDFLFIVNTAGTGFQINFAGANIRDVGNVAIPAGHLGTFIWSGGAWHSRT